MAAFGEYIRSKRLEKSISVRKIASLLSCSPSYVVSVEKGIRNPFDKERLLQLIDILELSEEEKNTLFDLAGRDKKVKAGDTVAVDLSEYIKENDHIRAALRTARDLNATQEEWFQFVKDLEEREKRKND